MWGGQNTGRGEGGGEEGDGGGQEDRKEIEMEGGEGREGERKR